MLAKTNRLTKSEFTHHFKKGTRFHSPVATLIMSPHTHFHGAVVVGKKISKKAVVRNKLRRRVYALLYLARHVKKTGVYIVIIKPLFTTLSPKEQRSEIKKLIELAH